MSNGILHSQQSALQTYYTEYLVNRKHIAQATVGHFRGALDRISKMLKEKNLSSIAELERDIFLNR